MTAPGLFTLPTPAAACGRCGEQVLRVRDEEIGINVDLDLQPLSVTRQIPAGQVVLERHPRIGWHNPSSPARRGYPVHLIHTCTRQDRKSASHD